MNPAPAVEHPALPADGSGPTLWRRVRSWAVPLLGICLVALLAYHARRVDWAGAWHAMKSYPATTLASVLGLATLSHALYGCFDLLGKLHTRHRLASLQTWAIAMTSYAFNLNLGSLVGGVAMRARLYARAGIDEVTTAQIVGLSLATNWLGYGLVAGSLFAAGALKPPAQAHLSPLALQAIGVLLLCLAAGYVALCFRSGGREWTVRGRRVRLPTGRIALAQLALSAVNWTLMGTAMYLLLGDKVGYGMALGALLAASIAGVITPIPAGLGVLEAVYLAVLHGTLRPGAILGAVLAYRALYYLLPLLGGMILYVVLGRVDARRAAASTESPSP